MNRDVCDRCLKVNVTDEPFKTLEIRLGVEDISTPDLIETGMSICDKCQPVVVDIITGRIMLTETPADVKRGSLFYKSGKRQTSFTSDTGDEITAADFEDDSIPPGADVKP